MKEKEILAALVTDALYTYEFDVTTGIVEKDIVSRNGVNFTKELRLESPCSFDEMIKRSFGDFLKCRYTSDSYITELSQKSLLNAYACGKTRLEANICYSENNQYVRLTYLLYRQEENRHVYAYVICEDTTELERRKDSSLDRDNQKLKKERETLTDDLNYQNNFTKVLMEQMNCGVLAYSLPERKLIHINREALRVFGWESITEAIKKLPRMWEDVTLNDQADEEKLKSLREQQCMVQYQFTVHEGDAERQILAESKSLTGRHSGSVVISTFMDITHTRMLEEDRETLTGKNHVLSEENIELNQASDAVHAILNAGSYICTYDAMGEKLVEVKYSEALRKLFGYSGEDDFPNNWNVMMECILPEDRKYVEESYQRAMEDHTGNTLYDVTYRCIRRDGEIRWQRAAGYVMRRADGSPITCYGLIMDVDDQKKAADKVDEALTQAQMASAAKTSFLARMSHDIRTPMNGILGLIEINETHAEDKQLTSRNRKKAKVAADYLLSLINDVLQLSKLEDPNVTLSHEAFNAQELAENILTIISMRAVEYGVSVEYHNCADSIQYPYVWGSPLHVRQIFINILSNAIKYNKKNGKIFGQVMTEKVENQKVYYKVVIKDTGIGMSREFLEHIFEPFAREHSETSRYEGTGLGMSIVKQLVEKMDGTIDVASKEDIGTTFTVTIPFMIASEADIQKDEKGDLSCNIAGRRILLVEDNELNMEIAGTFLEDAGAAVTRAGNGQQAVRLFEETPEGTFDAILMDVMMPVMNGYEATREIRKMDRKDAKTIPVIAMTANAFAEDIQESRQAGMNEHLSKPLDSQKLITTVARLLGQ